MNWFYVSSLLQAALGIWLLATFVIEQKQLRQLHERLGQTASKTGRQLLHNLSDSELGRKGLALDSETALFLHRIGWRKRRQRSLFTLYQFGTPMVLLVLVQLFLLVNKGSSINPWLLMIFALGIGYLLPKRLLARAASKRQELLVQEVSAALPLMRILFEVGMLVEQALRILAVEGRDILPVMSYELTQMMQRVDAGLDLGAELRRTAELMDVEELTDCFMVLEQLSQQGSGAMSSLLSMKKMLDERRVTRLQEVISKMSAKMSIVMVAFLFPALLIVLAGPGFIAIIRAFGDMG